jgi:hypothetical protein
MAELDTYTGVAVRDGVLEVHLSSGSVLPVDATVPLPGVLRLRMGSPPAGESGILVEVEDNPARLVQQDNGVTIEGPGVHAFWDGQGQGVRCGSYERFSEPQAATVPFASGRRPADTERCAGWVESVRLSPDGGIYGGGESYQGLNLRKRFRRLRNTEVDREAGRDSAYLNVPLLWSDDGWGLFLHTGAVVEADLGATHSEAARIEVDGDRLDLFLIAGDARTILQRYLALTGRPRAMPDWAFGVWMSRSSYFTADEVVSTVDDLTAAGCPVDVIHVDEWLDEVVLDEAAWSTGPNRKRFPAGWTDRLRERSVRASVWINPYLGKETTLGEQAAEYLVRAPDGGPSPTADNPKTLPVDFTDPPGRRWWVDRLTTTLTEEGTHAVLADFGEEVAADAKFATAVRVDLDAARLPLDVVERLGFRHARRGWLLDAEVVRAGTGAAQDDDPGCRAAGRRTRVVHAVGTVGRVLADHAVSRGRRTRTDCLPRTRAGRRHRRLSAAQTLAGLRDRDREGGHGDRDADDAPDDAGLSWRSRGAGRRAAVLVRPGHPRRAAAGARRRARRVASARRMGSPVRPRPGHRPWLAASPVRAGPVPRVAQDLRDLRSFSSASR